MSEDENDGHNQSVRTLIDQLKENNKAVKKAPHGFELNKEDLEQFILNNTGRLIQDSMETIDTIKQFVVNAPEPEDVHSLAELYKASTSAIEALNKILLQQQKTAAAITVKTMDIQSKLELKNDSQDKVTFTRDEIFDKLITKAEIIEVEDITGSETL